MSKVHVIKDESLGGIEREYVEVGREANEGDYINVTKFNYDEKPISEIRKVDRLDDDITGDFILDYPIDDEYYFDSENDEYMTLEPSDIVRIDGERFRMLERKAAVGEKVVISFVEEACGHEVGMVLTVSEVYSDGSGIAAVGMDDYFPLDHEEYKVLEPVKTADDEFIELIANLARRVSSLESQVESLQNDVVRQAEELENYHTNYLDMLDVKYEMLMDDIVMLDERTQPKKDEVGESFLDSISEKIADRLIGGVRQ